MAKGRETEGSIIEMEVVQRYETVARINVLFRVRGNECLEETQCRRCSLKKGPLSINKCTRPQLVETNGSGEQQITVSVDKESIPRKTGCGVTTKFPEIFGGKNTIERRRRIMVGQAVETW